MKYNIKALNNTHLSCIDLFLKLVDFVNSVSVKKDGPFPYLNSKNSEYGSPYQPISVNFRCKCDMKDNIYLLIMMRRMNYFMKGLYQ
jgi:hypothetical protein